MDKRILILAIFMVLGTALNASAEDAEPIEGNFTGTATSDEKCSPTICLADYCGLCTVDVSGSVDKVTWLGSIPAYYEEPQGIAKGDKLTGYVALQEFDYIDGHTNDYWVKRRNGCKLMLECGLLEFLLALHLYP